MKDINTITASKNTTAVNNDQPQPLANREAIVSESASNTAGTGAGILAGSAITAGLLKFNNKFKNFALNDAAKGMVGGTTLKGKAAIAGIVGGVMMIGSALMSGMARNANQQYRETKGQLDEASNIIANQEREIAGLRGEVPGARSRYASMGEQNFADRLQASRANASELGL